MRLGAPLQQKRLECRQREEAAVAELDLKMEAKRPMVKAAEGLRTRVLVLACGREQ